MITRLAVLVQCWLVTNRDGRTHNDSIYHAGVLR